MKIEKQEILQILDEVYTEHNKKATTDLIKKMAAEKVKSKTIDEKQKATIAIINSMKGKTKTIDEKQKATIDIINGTQKKVVPFGILNELSGAEKATKIAALKTKIEAAQKRNTGGDKAQKESQKREIESLRKQIEALQDKEIDKKTKPKVATGPTVKEATVVSPQVKSNFVKDISTYVKNWEVSWKTNNATRELTFMFKEPQAKATIDKFAIGASKIVAKLVGPVNVTQRPGSRIGGIVEYKVQSKANKEHWFILVIGPWSSKFYTEGKLTESSFSKYYRSPRKQEWLKRLYPKLKKEYPTIVFKQKDGFLTGNGKPLADLTANLGDTTTEQDFIKHVYEKIKERVLKETAIDETMFVRCPECNGQSIDQNKICPKCNGKGYLPKEAANTNRIFEDKVGGNFNVNKVWDFLETKPFHNTNFMPRYSTAKQIFNSFTSVDFKKYTAFDWKGTDSPLHKKEQEVLNNIKAVGRWN